MSKNEETAREIAATVSRDWPNGYSHRDHLPKATATIQSILDRAYPDPDPRLEQARGAVRRGREYIHSPSGKPMLVREWRGFVLTVFDQIDAALAPKEKL